MAAVVIYHINKTWLPGGYVGVDIFFVISGFLITSIIWRQLQDGTFSLADFYLRRIRRIIPVMLVVVAATLLAGAFLLLPDALGRLSLSSIFSVVSAANIYFWRYLDDDYFADASDQEPLLHLWSLGVEEQFYLVWPLLLLLVTVGRKNRIALAILGAVVIAVASFALAEATNETDPKFSYFMLPARAGELMIGALLALSLRRERGAGWLQKPLVAEGVGIAGLSAIAYSVFYLDDLSPFPGLNALYPCVGAALVILAGTRSRLLQWLLANKPMVWIGLISYSLYLWHWPILAFIRYYYGAVAITHAVLAVAAMLVLSFLSYRYVEGPTRRIRWRGKWQVLFLLLLPASLVLVPAAYFVKTDGLKARIESSAGFKRLEEETAAAFNFDYNCQLSKHVPGILSEPRCLIGSDSPEEGSPRILLWGDSHASHHIGALDIIGKHAGLQIRNASHSSCPPVFGGDYGYGRYKAGCAAFRPYIREHVLNNEFDVVIFGASWSSYDKVPGFHDDLLATIAEVRATGARVVLLGRVPTLASYNRECDQRWARLGGSTSCSNQNVRNKGLAVNNYLAGLASQDSDMAYLDVGSAICNADWCPAYLGGHPIYFDRAHLSMRGSWRIGEHLIATGQAKDWIKAISGSTAGWKGPDGGGNHEWRRLPAPLELPAADAADKQLLAGIALGVPYDVVSDEAAEEGAERTRKIVIEFEQVDARLIGSELAVRMGTAGFRQTGSSNVRGGQRFNFRADDGVRATILVRPRGAVDLRSDRAMGSMEVIHTRNSGR
ncbi:acyltransferase [Luteimonas terricola]|uniref:Acyltransferase n=1 Tax=Luteimonas terricola TaxID=645597 RepID=A0ABQ2EIG0_9GAMM|nr:acyltransferase [Luteimonas terricola]